MSSRNSRSYSTSEVLLLLEQDEECLDEAVNLIGSADLEGESEDKDSPQGDGFLEDGSTLLVPSECLAPGGLEILQTLEPTTPAERQSLLLQDPEFSEECFDDSVIINSGNN